MELITLERDKLAQLPTAIDLIGYDEELATIAQKYFDMKPPIINRTTWHILNPHQRNILFETDPTKKDFVCLLVDVPAEQEIAAAIMLAGGINGTFNARPKDSQDLIRYSVKLVNNPKTRELLFTMGQDVDYWRDFFEWVELRNQPKPEEELEEEPQPIPEPDSLGIPILDIKMQARKKDLKGLTWKAWSSIGRQTKQDAYHFYVEDERFRPLEKDNSKVPKSGAKVAIELNYSTSEIMPLAPVIGDVWRKRATAKDWQHAGVRILVDMNVSRSFIETNMIGVPPKWKAYANRYNASDTAHLYEQFERAKQHAQSDKILYLVYGTNGAKALCEAEKWHFVDYEETSRRNG